MGIPTVIVTLLLVLLLEAPGSTSVYKALSRTSIPPVSAEEMEDGLLEQVQREIN